MKGGSACILAVALSAVGIARGFHFATSKVFPTRSRVSGEWGALVSGPREGHKLVQSLKAVMSASKTTILVTGNNVDMTEPLKEYVNKKLENKLEKVGGGVSKVDVHLNVNKNPSVKQGHVAEVTVFVKGHVVRASEATESMYASIDLVSDRIMRKLRQYKERKTAAKRHRKSAGDVSAEVTTITEEEEELNLDEFEDFKVEEVAMEDMTVVKQKSFPMPSITLDEAVFCLGCVDHDFYVFRNIETDEINVVYKRNHGGLGHIEPEPSKK